MKGRFVKMPTSSMSDDRVKGEGKTGNGNGNRDEGIQVMMIPSRLSGRGDDELRPGISRAKEDGKDDDDYMEEEEEDEEDGEYRDDIINGNDDDDDDDGYLELIDDNAASLALSLLSGSKELVLGTDLDQADDDDDGRYGYHGDDGGSGTISTTLSSSSSSIPPSSPMQFSLPSCSNPSNNRYRNDSIHMTSTVVTGRNGYRNNSTIRKAKVEEVKGLITPSSCDRDDDAEAATISALPPQRKMVQQDIVVSGKRIRRHSIAY